VSHDRATVDSDPTQGTTSGAEAFQTRHVVTVSLAHALHDMYASFLPPLLPALMAKLTLSNTQAGLLAFISSSPSLLQPVIGYLADRASLRYFVVLAPALAATTMSLLGLAPRYAVAALLVAVAGLSSAAFHAASPALTGQLSGRRLGRGLGLWTVGGSLGYAMGPVLVATVVNVATLRGTPWLMIGGWIGSAILYLLLRNVTLEDTTTDATSSWRRGMKDMRPILVPLTGIVLTRAMAFAAAFTFLPTLLTAQGLDLWLAGISVSLVHVASAGGSLLAGSASDNLGYRLIASLSILTSPILLLALVLVPGWPQVPVLIGLGLTMPATYVILMALVQESCPDNRALATGVLLSLTFVSESLGAVVLGALADLIGMPLAFAVSAIVLLASLPLAFLLPRRSPALLHNTRACQ
jgi:FSR family fosmidomycin resistance protein-like MFS transporter